MKLSIKAGTTSKTINIFIQDSSSTTGAGLTGLAFNTAGLTAYYALPRAAATAITLATQTVTGAFSSGGFVEISSTNMPGWYRFDIPDAAIASGSFTSIHFKGATNMAPLPIEIELTAWDNQDTVRGGLTALPNATAGANTGLPVVGTQVPNATAGAANGLLISGSNSGTTTLGALTVTGTATISDGLVINRSTGNSSAIVATGNGTGHGAVFSSGAGATGDGVQITAGSTNGNGLKLTKTGTGVALAAPTTDMVLAKTTNITGFNDIAATAIVSSGAITTSGGAVSTVTTVTNLTNAPTAGDLTATMKTSVASAVLDATATSYNTAGTIGNKINSAASAGDPWTTAVPGAYSAGSAGYILGTYVTQAVGTLTSSERNSVADAILARNVSGGSSTGRTVKQALHFLRNKWVVSAGTLTVYDTDDSTSSWTSAVTSLAGADPIVGNDPA